MKFLSSRSKNILLIVGLVAGSFIALWPLLHRGFFITDDGEWMVIRLSAFYQALRDGQFPVRFLGRLYYSYGYPVSNFLYPGFLYIGSIIHILGFSFVDSIKILFGGSVILTVMFGYKWMRTSQSQAASFVGALNIALAPYLLYDIYTRGSVGEVLGIAMAAVCFYSLTTSKGWLLAPFVGFLILSHNTLALLFLLVFFVYIIVGGRHRLLVPYSLGIMFATFFWLPAVLERRFTQFDSIVISDVQKFFVNPGSIILIGLVSVVTVVLFLYMKKRIKNPDVRFHVSIFLISLFFASSLSNSFWHHPTFSLFIQFPFRFLALGILSGSWIAAVVFDHFIRYRTLLLIFFISLWTLSAVPIFMSIRFVNREVGYYTTNEATTTVADEYLPRWVKTKMVNRSYERLAILGNDATIYDQISTTKKIRALISSASDLPVQINTIYYPGWGVLVDGQPVSIDYSNPYGLIRFTVPKGNHRVLVEFRETFSRFIADMLTVVSIGIYVGYYIW